LPGGLALLDVDATSITELEAATEADVTEAVTLADTAGCDTTTV